MQATQLAENVLALCIAIAIKSLLIQWPQTDIRRQGSVHSRTLEDDRKLLHSYDMSSDDSAAVLMCPCVANRCMRWAATLGWTTAWQASKNIAHEGQCYSQDLSMF